jgi:twitching motility protein PilI
MLTKTESEFFSFQLADSIQVALPLNHVEKIIQVPRQQICPLPGITPYWAGITSYQGTLLWILDGEQFFNLPAHPLKRYHHTAVVMTLQTSETRRRIALSVQSLKGMIALDLSTASDPFLCPLPPQFQSLFCASIFAENDLLLVLEVDHFFNSLSAANDCSINI